MPAKLAAEGTLQQPDLIPTASHRALRLETQKRPICTTIDPECTKHHSTYSAVCRRSGIQVATAALTLRSGQGFTR